MGVLTSFSGSALSWMESGDSWWLRIRSDRCSRRWLRCCRVFGVVLFVPRRSLIGSGICLACWRTWSARALSRLRWPRVLPFERSRSFCLISSGITRGWTRCWPSGWWTFMAAIRPSGWSTRRPTSSRAGWRRGCSGNGVAKSAKKRTAWWASTCFTPATTRKTRSPARWRAIYFCPNRGPTIASAAGGRGFPTTWCTGPSGGSRSSRSSGVSGTACVSAGSRSMKSTAAFRSSGSNSIGWASAASARCGRISPAGRRCPHYCSQQKAHASQRVDNVCRYSKVFRNRGWHRLTVKQTTRGPAVWELKAGRVHLVDTSGGKSRPTDREYWLIVARNTASGETKYFVSNAAGGANWKQMMRAAFARWHVEMWFERAKQETGLGAFEVRTYTGLIRHWLCSRIAMYFLAEQTERLRGEKSADHARASSRGGQRPGLCNLETQLACAGWTRPHRRIPPGTQRRLIRKPTTKEQENGQGVALSY